MASNINQHNQLLTLFAAYAKRLDKLYDDFITRLVSTFPYTDKELWDKLTQDPLFRFDDLPYLSERLQHIFNDFVNNQVLCYKAGITDGVALAYSQDKVNLGKYTILQDAAIEVARNAAVTSFIANRMSRKEGLSLSDKVWNYAQLGKSEVEMGISNVIKDGLKAGTSAEELGRKVRQYLNNPTMMYRRYWVNVALAGGGKKKVARWYRRYIDEKTGKVTFKQEPLEKVGTGVYRSARMNSYRLMRTEINMSYHKANASRWAKEPFVYGIRVWLSPQHPREDICDDLEGYYPKNFVFSGWHPNCYLPGARVLTETGWKEIQDITYSDKVLSLNPQTRNIEYVGITAKQAYEYNGDVEHFYNKSLDCEVTADHRMVFLSKNDGEIRYTTAKDYRKGKGAFYRGCNYYAPDIKDISINGEHINFDLFCEFMGYWLSDGSIRRDCEVVVSQKEGQPSFARIKRCITQLGHRSYYSTGNLSFRDKNLASYLLQFGKCNNKFVPREIMQASKRQITIFLNAFVKCDGYERIPHIFVGSRGNLFTPKNTERIFFTTSARLCGNISELLLKIGNRPSIGVRQPSVTHKKDGTYIIGNFDCFIINECHAKTATVFEKEEREYHGMVYDLTLSKNHIMYVQYHGTCFWGSNCMCASAPLTLCGDEKRDFYRRLMRGEDMSNFHSKNEITKENMNQNWWKYIDEEHKNIIKAAERGKLAYHLRDNQLYWLDKFSPAEREKMGLSPMPDNDRIAQIAAARHAARTPEQAKNIADRWHEHKRIDALIRQAEPLIADLKEYPAVARWRMLQTAVDERDGRALSNFLSDKLILKKLAYEKMITPEELKWSNYVKNFISSKSATVVHNSMARIVKEARNEKSAKDAIAYLKSNMKSHLRPLLSSDEAKVFQPILDREVRRMQDWFDYKSYAKSMDMLTELVDKNAATIGGAFKPLPFTSADFYFQDIKKMRSLINDKYYDAYMNLLKWNNASEFVGASKSPIVHQLYDGILNAYKAQGFTSDVEDMVNKLLDNIERLKKEAEKKMSFAYMQKDFATTSDIEETLKSINATLHGLDKWFQNGDCRLFVEKNKRCNGCTMMDGRIWLTQPRIDKSLSAFQKLAQKKAAEITKDEADAMATFWHEITHNRNIPGNMRLMSLQTRYMELANEYVARNTLPEFYAKLGVKDMPHKEFILTRESTNYNTMVTNYEYVVKTLDLDKGKVLSSLKKSLFENKYDEQKESLINALIDGGIKMANGKPVKESTLNELMGIVKDQKDTMSYIDDIWKTTKKEAIIEKWLKEQGLKK